MKEEILRRILAEEKKLNDNDVEGHVWWNKFREFIKDIPESGEQEMIEVDFRKLTVKNDSYKFDKK